MATAIVPPGEVSVEISLRVVKHKAHPAGMIEARFERCPQVGLRVAAQRIGPEIECDPQQGGRSRAEPPRRTELELNLPVGEDWRANVLLDAFDEMDRGSRTPDRRQHQAQRRASIFEIVDLQNSRCSSKPFNQVFELFTIVQTMNFETDR